MQCPECEYEAEEDEFTDHEAEHMFVCPECGEYSDGE